FDLYRASTGRTRKIGSRLRAANPARRDVLFLLSRPEAREGPTAYPDSEQFRSGSARTVWQRHPRADQEPARWLRYSYTAASSSPSALRPKLFVARPTSIGPWDFP